jgi:autotransporter-associated beta strand protein
VWTGANLGIWTTAVTSSPVSATPNWALLNAPNAPSDFWAGDLVQFNDTVNINGTVVAPTTTTVTIQGGNVSPTSATFNNSAVTYTVTSSDTSGIAGAGSVAKFGTGILNLNTSNTYSGGTTLNAGTLNIGNAGALGSGRLTLNGGTTFDNTTGGTANLSNNNTQTWSGSFTFAGTSSLNMGSGAVTLNGTPNLNVSNNTLSVGGVIGNGTGTSLTKSGGGTLALTGHSTYTGGTTVNGGTLSLGIGGGTGTIQGVLTINAGGTVAAAAGDSIGFGATAVPTINVNAGGVFNSLGGNQGFSTNFVLTGGTVSAAGGSYQFDSANGFGIQSLASPVTATFSGGITIRSGALDFVVAANIPANSVDLNVTGAIGGGNGITKDGAGALQLSGNNTFGTTTNVNAGTLKLASSTALPVGTALTVAGGASLVATHQTTHFAIVLSSLGNSGLVDLNNNGLDARAGNYSDINTQLTTGFNGGGWNGASGIVSTDAATDTTHLTTLGILLNDNGSGTPLYGANGSIGALFNGVAPLDGDVLVKATYYGDANLSGIVDGTDYGRIDNGFLSGGTLTGWYNGDFNYDGVINGSDYTLIDNAFNSQGVSLASQIATPTAELGGSTSAVPEPTTLGLLGISAIGLLGRRRRK